MIDHTDLNILSYLQKDSRMQFKEIGEKVHLTGQAVSMRVKKMEELGIIEGYTVKVNPIKIGKPISGFITVIMKTNDHPGFTTFISGVEDVAEAHRVSGTGCYQLRFQSSDHAALNKLLDGILLFGNYSLSISVEKVK